MQNRWSKVSFQSACAFLTTLKMSTRLLISLIFITLVLLVYYGIALGKQHDKNVFCSEQPIGKAVDRLCDLYEAGVVTGNYCPQICKKSHTVDSHIQCLKMHEGKEVVFELSLDNGTRVVVKSQYADISKYSTVYYTSAKSKIYPKLKEFNKMLLDTIKANIPESKKSYKKLIERLWVGNFKRDFKYSNMNLRAYMMTLWTLVQQHEYLLFRIFEGTGVFTSVIGTCGHFYVVEYLEPIQQTDYEYWKASNGVRRERPWIEKVKLSREIIRILDKLEITFQEPLHVCDVKLSHFGYKGITNFTVKMLDADASFFRSSLNGMVNNSDKCSKNNDCAFFDCLSTCDSKAGRCLSNVTNNNLQVICSRIFKNEAHPLYYNVFQGLLNNPPEHLKSTIEGLLILCSNPSESEQRDLRYAAPYELLHELQLFFDSEIFKSRPFITSKNKKSMVSSTVNLLDVL